MNIKHQRPRYYGYAHGTFTRVRVCRGCGLVALYEDAHPVRPCRVCGEVCRSADDQLSVARWIAARSVWWKPKTWGAGRWEFKHEVDACKAIAAGLGVGYEQVALDLKSVGYGSLRYAAWRAGKDDPSG